MHSSKTLGYLYVAVAAVIWGSNGVIVNYVALNAYAIAFFRVLFASLTLLPITLLTQRHELKRGLKAWKVMLALGGLLSLGWSFLFQSMKLIPIANAVLLDYTAPIFVAVLAPLLLKERMEKVTVLALILSMAGVIMISSQQGLELGELNLMGTTFGLLAGLSYAGFILLSKRVVSAIPSQVVAVYAYATATILLLPSLAGADLRLSLTSWVLLLVLGVLNTGFAVTLYLAGLRRVKAQRAVVYTYLEPVSAMLFGFIFLAQRPTPLMALGGFLIILAGYLTASK